MTTLVKKPSNKTSKYAESLSSFTSKFDEFLDSQELTKEDIPTLYPYENIEEIFKICQKKHTGIRESFNRITLGGHIKSEKLLDKIYNDHSLLNVNYTEINQHYNTIQSILENDSEYLKQYNITATDFIKGILPKNGRPIGKHWLKYANNDDYYGYNRNKLASLGEFWNGIKFLDRSIDKIKYEFHTSFLSFIKLGHYGADSGSCFAMGGCHEIDKLLLSIESNSFVLLLKDDDEIFMRAWGVKRNNNWYFTNFYFKDHYFNLTSFKVLILKLIMSKILNKDYDKLVVEPEDPPNINRDIYLNIDGFSIR
jgi:hypothetical protein